MEYLNIIIKAVLTCLTANYIISDIVLKCKFFYYSVMTRPTDQETIAIEKITCSRGGGIPLHEGSHRVSQEAVRVRGKTWAHLLWFL